MKIEPTLGLRIASAAAAVLLVCVAMDALSPGVRGQGQDIRRGTGGGSGGGGGDFVSRTGDTMSGALTVNADFSANTITALPGGGFSGDGSAIAMLNGSAVASGTLPAARLPVFTGDVTAPGGSAALTIGAGKVTLAMQANLGNDTLIGRNTSGSGAPEAITLTQLLDWIGSPAQGDILYRGASGWARLGAGASGNFLKTQGAGANPTWAAPGGGGDALVGSINNFTAQNTFWGVTITNGNLVVSNANGSVITIGTNGNITASGVITGGSMATSGSGVGTMKLYDADASNFGTITAPSTFAADRTLTLPDASGTLVLDSNTQTFTGKTYDAGATGNVLKFKSYLYLKGFDNTTGALALNTNDVTASTFMKPVFSNSADQAANFVEWQIQVPDDVDTSVEPRAKVKFKLAAADTGTHRYVISMASVADSAAYAGTVGTAINMDFAGDASGASGDVETVGYTTLTGWGAAVTAGQHWVIRLARDGDASQDASTVDSMLSLLVIEYGVTQ